MLFSRKELYLLNSKMVSIFSYFGLLFLFLHFFRTIKFTLIYTITFLRFILSLCIQVIFIEKNLCIYFIKYLILLLFVVAIDTIIQKFFGKNLLLFEIIGDGLIQD